MANPISRMLMLYLNGNPTGKPSELEQLLVKSIGFTSDGGTTKVSISEVSGAFDFDGKNITNVGTVDGRDVSADGTTLDGHIAGTSYKHAASVITVADAGSKYTATDVEAALQEVKTIADAAIPKAGGTMTGDLKMGSNNIVTSGNVDGRDVSADGSALDTHLTTGGTRHEASQVSISDALVTSTNVKQAVLEVLGKANTAKDAADVAQSDATTALSNAETAQETANAALPKVGGTMSGNIAMGGHDITGVGDVDGVDVSGLKSAYDTHVGSSATGAHTAANIAVADAGSKFTATEVEAALQEVKTIADAALPKSGGTMTDDLNMGSNDIVTSGLVDGVDVSALDSTVGGHTTSIGTLNTFKSDIESNTSNKGAKLVGFADPSSQFSSATVEGALDEALDAAQAAQATASSASSAASTAQGAADDAQADATQALSDAASAQSTANAALPKAGGNMTGDIDLGGTHKVKNAAPATNANDYVIKAQMDATGAGIDFQADVAAVQSDATTNPGSTPADGTRYIILDKDHLHANFGSITKLVDGTAHTLLNNYVVRYVASASEFRIEFDADAHTGGGILVWSVAQASFYNYSASSWSPFGGLSGVTAGVGLEKVGNVINVKLGAGIIELPTDEVGIDFKSDGGLYLADPTTGSASTLTDAQLSVKLDGSSLAKGSSGLKIGSGVEGEGVVLNSDKLQVQKSFVPFTNSTGATIVAGSVVMTSLTDAGKILKADSSAIANCEGLAGVVLADILDSASGLVQVSGEATIINGGTSLDLGKRAYLAATAGQATKTATTATNSVVYELGKATASNKVLLAPRLVIVNG